MVAQRILAPEASKLGMTRAWADTTLPEELGIADADEDALYEAMDWLVERQEAIEKRLARRHLKAGGLVLFDLTSSYFEGLGCPLARIGYSRDGKRGTLQVNYGLKTDDRGCPVSVSVFEGNVGDPKTLLPQVEKARTSFGLDRLVMVGGQRPCAPRKQAGHMTCTRPQADCQPALDSRAPSTHDPTWKVFAMCSDVATTSQSAPVLTNFFQRM
jgi:hypothetical protein